MNFIWYYYFKSENNECHSGHFTMISTYRDIIQEPLSTLLCKQNSFNRSSLTASIDTLLCLAYGIVNRYIVIDNIYLY